jgi:hypothetical protein
MTTPDSFSHWIHSMGEHTDERMEEALDESLLLTYC